MRSKIIPKIRFGVILLCAFILLPIKANADAADTDSWTRYQNSSCNNGVTERPGPTDAAHTISMWNVSMGSTATTPPLIVGDKVYTASGYYVYCFDKTTGEKLGESDKLTGYVGHALHPMVYAEGKLFVITDKSGTMVEALILDDPANPEKIWASTPQSGISYSPLTYHYNEEKKEGYLYTGTFNGDQSGYYFCVSASDGSVVWSKEDANGFYWAGAYATDQYVAFASENEAGGDNEAEGSALYTVDSNGKVIDSITDLKGSIRNTLVFDNGYLYVGTVAGRLYRVKVDPSGKLGKYSGINDENFSYIDLGGRIKATTVVYNDRIYVGVEGKNTGDSCYKVIDCSKAFTQYSTISTVSVPDEPKGAPILSAAEDETLYLYFTCNQRNGGIYYLTFKENGESLSSYQCLFDPETQQQERCISSLALDTDGTIYYTNDSHYLMAVSPKLIKDVGITTTSGSTSGIRWNAQQFYVAARSYDLTAGDMVSGLTLNIQKMDGDDEAVSFRCIVNGADQGSNTTIALSGESTTAELLVTRGKITLSYYFHIYKVTAENTALSLLYYGENYYSGGNLLPDIEEGKTEYSVDLRKVSANDPYLWILPLNSSAQVEVYCVENVKQDGQELKSGKVLDPVFYEKSGEYKFEVIPADSAKNTVIRVCVTSADGSRTQDYQVKFIRTDATVPSTPSTPAMKPATPSSGAGTQSSSTTTTGSSGKTTTTTKVTKPKKVTRLTAKKKKNTVTLKWKKVKGATGYQITIAKDKKFRKSKTVLYIKKASICTKKIKLTKNRKYVRIRAYVKKNGKKVYGAYSKTKRIN